MKPAGYYIKLVPLLLGIILVLTGNAAAPLKHSDSRGDTAGLHELTLYTIAPVVPINWESPSSLYKTVVASVVKMLQKSSRATLGHMFFKLETDLLPEPLWAGLTLFKKSDMFKEFLIYKSGLSLLGKPFKAKVEGQKTLEKYIKSNSKEHTVAFITYRINEGAARRILTFLTLLIKEEEKKLVPTTYYSANSWPLYEGEGTDCSALIVASLELAGLPLPEADQWKVSCKVPLSLIGGRLNNQHKVRIRSVRKTKTWYQGAEENGVGYADFETVDPCRVRTWILKQYGQPNSAYQKTRQDNVPGLYVDYRSVMAPISQPMLSKRKGLNYFLKNNPFHSNNLMDSVPTHTGYQRASRGGASFSVD